MTGLQRQTGRPLATVRSVIEISVVMLGWSLGGVVGIGTLMFAFIFIGRGRQFVKCGWFLFLGIYIVYLIILVS